MPNSNSNTRPVLKSPSRKRGKGNYGRYVISFHPPLPLTAPGFEVVTNAPSGTGSSKNDITPVSTATSQAVKTPPLPEADSRPSLSGEDAEEIVPTLSPEDSLRKELEQAHRREEELVVSLNEYKEERKRLKVTMLSEQMSINVLTEKMKIVEGENALLKAENDGLKKFVEELQAKEDPTAKGPSKLIAKITKTVEKKHSVVYRSTTSPFSGMYC